MLKLLKLLVDGDVESNPGPTTTICLKLFKDLFIKVTRNLVKLLEYSVLVIPYFRYVCPLSNVFTWNTHDLDYVLESGDQLYKRLNTNNILSVDDLPHNVVVERYALTTTLLENETGIMNIIGDLDFLEQSYLNVSDTGNGLIFFINEYTFSLIWSK